MGDESICAHLKSSVVLPKNKKSGSARYWKNRSVNQEKSGLSLLSNLMEKWMQNRCCSI